MKIREFESLLEEVRACTICKDLPAGPRPVVAAHPRARILIVGQAPGRRVHESGVAWDDASGKRLREWLGIDRDTFYDAKRCALVPMGFCYPGTGTSGDLPPRPECAPAWHDRVLKPLQSIRVTILASRYAQQHFLGDRQKPTLTETVRSWRDYFPEFLPIPHPSPRNNRWLKANPWFDSAVLPALRKAVREALA